MSYTQHVDSETQGVRAIAFKHEDDGPSGPVWAIMAEDDRWQPVATKDGTDNEFSGPELAWYDRSQAVAMAGILGVPLEDW
jgi:hypothetical protein